MRKLFSVGLVMWSGWRMTGLLRGDMYRSVQLVAQQASRGRKGWIDTMKDCLKKNREVWMSGKQGEWYIIGMNGGGL